MRLPWGAKCAHWTSGREAAIQNFYSLNSYCAPRARTSETQPMSIIHQPGGNRVLNLHEPEKPQLYRELFPYTSICRTSFDEVLLAPRPAEQMRITDTTFRDGQQARPPYTVKQVAKMFDFLHRLGGKTGLITASELDRKSTRLNSSHSGQSRMPSSA